MTRSIRQPAAAILWVVLLILTVTGALDHMTSAGVALSEAIPLRAVLRYYILRDYIKSEEPMPIRFKHSPLAITGIIIGNVGNKDAIHVPVSIEDLGTEIKELVLIREKISKSFIRELNENQEWFQVDACKGKKEIHFKIMKFPAKSYLTVLILTDKINIPIVARNRIFINGNKAREMKYIFEYTKKYKVSVIGTIVILGVVILLLWKRAKINKAQTSEQGKKG